MDKSIFLRGVLIGTLVVVCISACGKDTASYVDADEVSQVEEAPQVDTFSDSEEEEPLPEEMSQIYVYVCGEVTSPGVYILLEGSRICDAFEQAGGLTDNAAIDYWNQARILEDGEMLYVPTKEEAKELRELSNTAVSPENTQNDTKSNKVNINTASKETLMTLPGIGEAKAQAIINYRQTYGSFASIEEIMNVEGIKEGMYEKIKEYIVIN